MNSIFRNLGAGALVAGFAVGTMGQGTMVNLTVNSTCQNTAFADNIHYTAGTTTGTMYYTLDLTKVGQPEGGTGYEVIKTPTETFTASLQPIAFNIGNFGSGSTSDANLVIYGGTTPYSTAFNMDLGGITLQPTLISLQEFCSSLRNGALYPTQDIINTSDHSPGFHVDTMSVPEPPTVLITDAVLTAGQFKCSFNSVLGHTHAVRYRTDPHSGLWQTLTNIVGDGFLKTVQTPATNTACFIQVVTQ